MKTNYALFLSFEGITLVRRTMAGWIRVGDVPLDADDLDAALLALRRKADAMSSDAGRVKLVIPNEHIRYLDLQAGGRRGEALTNAIRDALDGATPYAVDELVYDWAELPDGTVQVAAVARETLNEAQDFALSHHFNPVSFVASPPAEAFRGEVFFGPASGGRNGAAPERDARPVVIVDPQPVRPAAEPGPEVHAGQDANVGGAAEPAAAEPRDDYASDDPDHSEPDHSEPDHLEPDHLEPDHADRADADGRDLDRAVAIEARSVPEHDPVGDAGTGVAPASEEHTSEDPAPEPLPEAATDRREPRFAVPEPVASRYPTPAHAAAAVPVGEPEALTRDDAPDDAAYSATGDRATAMPTLPAADTPANPGPVREDNAPLANGHDRSRQPAALAAESLRVATPDDLPARAPGFASIRASRPAPDAPVPKLSGARAASAPAAPRLTTRPEPTLTPPKSAPDTWPEDDEVPDSATAAPIASLRRETVISPDLPTDEPASRPAKSGFFSRRRSRTEPAAQPQMPQVTRKTPASTGWPRVAIPEAAPLPPVNRAAAPGLSGAPARSSQRRPGGVISPPPTEDETDRMTIFGARRKDARVGGKPRFLGLMLTVALLLFLAAVAAWAAVFMDEGLARFFQPDGQPEAVALLPEAGAVDPSAIEPEPEVEVASLAPGLGGEQTAAAPALAEPVRPRALSPEEAEATYAATGIWQRAPAEPGLPAQVPLEDFYVASIDPPVQQFDAVALPEAKAYGTDYAMLSPASPAAAGTEFALDDRGLVVATPEGAMNPDGILVYAGLPPAVPPRSRPEPGAEDLRSPEERARRDDLAGTRPRARPGDLVEQSERATLAGRSVAELAALRPKLRPETVKAVQEEQQPRATRQAVNVSPTPIPRPRNFAATVEKARARGPEPEAASVASAAPRTVAPSVPSTANVAREATVRNQLNLSRVNLIGVYGTPSSRRALVRLSNGRYQKVKVGDRIDGGRVAAIGESELRYVKGGRNVVLQMPQG